MSSRNPVVPHGEAMRKAIKWIAEQGSWNLEAVAESARRFDLSPLEEEFLVQQFLNRRGIGS